MDNDLLQRLQKIAQQSPYNQQQQDMLAKQLEHAAAMEPSAPAHYVPFKKPQQKERYEGQAPEQEPPSASICRARAPHD